MKSHTYPININDVAAYIWYFTSQQTVLSSNNILPLLLHINININFSNIPKNKVSDNNDISFAENLFTFFNVPCP